MKKSAQQRARLRVCMSCEWIFKSDFSEEYNACPKCGMGHYGARYVYGDSAYRYAKTQTPWKRQKLSAYEWELEKEIQSSNVELWRAVRRCPEATG